MPPVKLFVDSRFRRDGTNSDFSFALPRPIEINKPYRAMVDQVHIPHVWTTINSYNQALYLEEIFNTVVNQRKLYLTIKQYTGDTLAAELQTQLNAGSFLPASAYTVSFDAEQGKLSLILTTQNVTARLFPMSFLLEAGAGYFVDASTGEGVVANDSADHVVGLTRQTTLTSADGQVPLEHVSMNPFHTLYLHCDYGMGTGEDAVGPLGNGTILRSLPVATAYGSIMPDLSLNPHDYTLVNPGQLQTFKFRLADSLGRSTPLSMPFSFSILLSAVDDLE
jgi:hypothetical protein